MTVRRKFNVAMLAMFCMLLATTGVVQIVVRGVSSHGLSQARMRELSVFTGDVRAEIFYQQAVARGFGPMREEEDWWPEDVLRDVEVRIHHAQSDTERDCWQSVHDSMQAMSTLPADDPRTLDLVRSADQKLRTLSREYDRRIGDGLASIANVVSTTQSLVFAAVLLSALLFAVVTFLIRDWFVNPINALNEAAHKIGEGRLDHRISLDGTDELSQLASQINTMSEKIAAHQKQLVEAHELATIGEMCTNVAHGLRNPLAGMRAGAQLAVRRSREHTGTCEVFEDIIREIDCMDTRITQLFEYSRTHDLTRSPTTVEQLVRDAEVEVRGVFDSRDITIQIDDKTLGKAWMVDRDRLVSAIGELFTNAVHHSTDAAVIDVHALVESNGNGSSRGVRISVRDYGSGIPPQSVERIFDLFYTSRPNGTGMGLPLVRRLIERHGGTIDVRVPKDGGAEFSLLLTDAQVAPNTAADRNSASDTES
jgi:two-component system, NtrC family, sensor kinase